MKIRRFFAIAALAAVIMLIGQPVFAGQTVPVPTPYGGVVLNVDPEFWTGDCKRPQNPKCAFSSVKGKMNSIGVYVLPLTSSTAKTPPEQAAAYNKWLMDSYATNSKCLKDSVKTEERERWSKGIHIGPHAFNHLRTIHLFVCRTDDGREINRRFFTDFLSPVYTQVTVAVQMIFVPGLPGWQWDEASLEAFQIRRVLGEMTIPGKGL